MTIAGHTTEVFKKEFMEENSILLLPDTVTSGYARQQQSQLAIKYLKWYEQQTGLHVTMGTNGVSEPVFEKMRVDGFVDQNNEIIEINGCFFHGCPKVDGLFFMQSF